MEVFATLSDYVQLPSASYPKLSPSHIFNNRSPTMSTQTVDSACTEEKSIKTRQVCFTMLPSLTALLCWSPTRRPERGAALREHLGHPPLDGVHCGLDQVGRRALHRRVDRLPLRRRPRVRVGTRSDLRQVPPPTAQRLHISASPVSCGEHFPSFFAIQFSLALGWKRDDWTDVMRQCVQCRFSFIFQGQLNHFPKKSKGIRYQGTLACTR